MATSSSSNRNSRVRAVPLLTIGSSALLAGYITSFSFISTPLILLAPTEILVRQWRQMFLVGSMTAPVLALANAVGYIYLARNSSPHQSLSHKKDDGLLEDEKTQASQKLKQKEWTSWMTSQTSLYSLAAVLTVLIVPFTALIMKPRVNDSLMGLATMAEKGLTGEGIVARAVVEELCQRWSSLNYVRAGLITAATVVAGFAQFV